MSQNESSHIADGIGQSERYPASLRPDFFKIEEREREDLLRFIIELSQHFNFYNLNNEIEGNWQDFLIADVNIILRVLPKFDINTFIRQYDNQKSLVLDALDDKSSIDSLSDLLHFIDTFVNFQEILHHKFRVSGKSDPEIFEFRKLVKEHDYFDEEIASLKKYMYQANLYFGEGIKVSRKRKLNEAELKDFYSNPEHALDGTHIKAHIDNLLPKLDKIFYSLRSKYNRLSEAAALYLHKQSLSGDSFDPHIALLIAFLDLYQYLKKDINGFTKKHLDLYYNRILQVQRHGAAPDSVNLLFDLNPNNSTYTLEKGEVLLAKDPVTGAESMFQTDAELQVTTARIKELRTLYVSNNIKIPSKDDLYADVSENQVFVSANPVYDPGDFLSGKNNTLTWPLVGEDQSELSVEERSMIAADLGLFLASPLLYAKDGKRNFRIRFYINARSAQGFMAHVDNYAHVSGINQKVLIYEMLSKAFNVQITGEEGWVEIKKYTASFEYNDASDNFIELDFELTHTDPSTAVYQPDLHGFDYHTEWPVIRFMVNNNSFHNPYTFLKDIHLQRVAIRLTVTDSEHLKMRNNIGAVSASNPFPIFGPQASVGSYFDIKNANIFNCYTRNFTIRLNWFDLPRDKGGFETYYRSYKPEVKNDSFKVSISGLNEGRFQPAIDNQQSFHLFAIGEEPGKKNMLSPVTVIRNIDFSKIHFDNTPSFSQEDENTEADFKEGAVRLEFISPAEGFGQRVYPALFSEIILHNSKRFKRKIPIPNPPYAAVVSKVSVDYVLEHSEAIGGLNKETEKHQNLIVWHHDPMGYKRIYPGSDGNELSFVPVFKDQSNLLIGLRDVPENQVLTLLFQIEESNFHDSSYEAESIQWCILQDNKWQAIDKSDVLLDNTLNFINSGIVRFVIPDLSDKPSTIMDPSCLWIKASCNNRGDMRTRIQAVFTQCTSATRILSGDDAQELTLAAGAIKEFQRKIPEILNVWQPFASYGGKPRETEEKYYVRVSERLRHKQRPITTTDIAQLVLEAFPNILKVYCYGIGTNNNVVLSGYDVQVIVIPRKNDNAGFLLEEPKLPLAGLYQVRKLITDNVSPFVKVDVANPVYERVKVVCSVMFNKSYSKASVGNNISRLNSDIRRFISPWIFNADADVQMEGRTYLSEILNFIKNRPYVSHVTSFSVLHFYNSYNAHTGRYDSHLIDSAIETTGYLKGSVPGAILISAPNHDITVLDEHVYKKSEGTGIGGLVIAEEFLVDLTEEENATKKENTTGGEEEYDFYFNPNA